MNNKFKTVVEYLNSLPKETREVLDVLREVIRDEIPDAEEVISYQILCFKLQGKYMVYCAGWKSHISMYPIPTGTESFRKEIEPYMKGKGTLQFALDKPLPIPIIKKVIQITLKERTRDRFTRKAEKALK